MSAKHILVIRTSAMGDVAMTVPVVAALRESRPELRITVLTRKPFRAFYQGVPDIMFADFEPKGRHKGLFGLFRLASELKASGVDTVADLHSVLRSRTVTFLLGMKGCRTASLRKGRCEKRRLTRRCCKRLVQLRPMTDRYADVFDRLGLKVTPHAIPFRAQTTLPDNISALVENKTGAWVGIAPFAKHASKTYPSAHMERLIDLLERKNQKIFIFGGGEAEAEFGRLLEQRHSNTVSVIGTMNLAQEMLFMQSLDAMVTMDSSSMHIASIVGVPVVSVWGATHPYAGFYGFGQDPALAVGADLPCRPCSVFGQKKCRFGDIRCMTLIEPGDVARKVAKVIEKASK